jgi:hypothetical protein
MEPHEICNVLLVLDYKYVAHFNFRSETIRSIDGRG